MIINYHETYIVLHRLFTCSAHQTKVNFDYFIDTRSNQEMHRQTVIVC